MKTILHINSSARYSESVSRDLSNKLVKKLAGSEDKVITRDLNNDMIFVTEASLGAVGTPKADRTENQNNLAKLADTLIEELQSSDAIVIGAPIYNFGVPASLKAWADLVARAGTTFKYTENGPQGLLTGKKAWIVAVSGGTPVGSDIDYMTPWLKFFLSFIGVKDVEVIVADGIFGQDGQEKIQKANSKISQINA